MQNTETQNIPAQPVIGNVIKLTSFSQRQVTNTDFIIEDTIIDDTTICLYGQPKAKKSFFAIDMLWCVAAKQFMPNLNFFGRKILKSMPVLYVAAEGQKGIDNRLEGLAIKYGANDFPVPFYKTEVGAIIDSVQGMADILATCDHIKQMHGEYPLVAFDTLRKTSQGNENSQQDMGAYVRAMDAIKHYTGRSSMTVHHTNKGGTISGSNTLTGGVDTQIGVFACEDNENNIVVKNDASKDTAGCEDLVLRYETHNLKFNDAIGKYTTTITLHAVNAQEEQEQQKNNAEPKARKLIDSQQNTLNLLIREMGDALEADYNYILTQFENNHGFSKKQTKQKFAGLIGKKVIDIKNNTITLTL